jgi:hypothetical protein
MIKIALLSVICVIVLAATRSHGQTPSEALVEQAKAAADIQAAGNPPFRLVARFQVLEGGAQLQGNYTLIWESPTAWRAETWLPAFSDVRIADGNKLWISRQPAYFTPRIVKLWSLLNFPKGAFPVRPEKLAKIKTKKEDGVDYETVEVSDKHQKLYRLYFGVSAHLLRQKTYDGTGFKRLFEDYTPFGKLEFPRTLIEISNRKPIVKIHVEELSEIRSLPPDVLVPPTGARWMPWCPQPKGLEFKGYTKPIPPLSVDISRDSHPADIYGVIGPDGRWHNLTIVRSGGKDFDAYFMNMLSAERYSPAMCPNGPMYVERSVEFTPPPYP